MSIKVKRKNEFVECQFRLKEGISFVNNVLTVEFGYMDV